MLRLTWRFLIGSANFSDWQWRCFEISRFRAFARYGTVDSIMSCSTCYGQRFIDTMHHSLHAAGVGSRRYSLPTLVWPKWHPENSTPGSFAWRPFLPILSFTRPWQFTLLRSLVICAAPSTCHCSPFREMSIATAAFTICVTLDTNGPFKRHFRLGIDCLWVSWGMPMPVLTC